MFGLGVPELIFILLLALLIFGPKRLPEIGRTLGRGMSEFRKASNELKRTINVELALDEQPEPPVRPYRPTQLDALRAPRLPDGSPAPVVPGGVAPLIAEPNAPDTPEAPAAPEGAASLAEPDDKPDELT